MTPPTTLLDRVRLRLRSRRRRAADLDAAEARALGWQRELLTERASHGRTRDLIAQTLGILTGPGIEVDVDALVEVVRVLRRRARGAENDRAQVVRLDDAIEDARRVLRTAGHTVGDELAIGDDLARAIGAERDQRDALDHELEQVRAELRATGHPDTDIRGGVSYAVDAAIDRERSRAQDLVERLADVLGWAEHRAVWPFSAPHLVREIAVRLGKPMPRRSPRLSDWDGSRTARALACTCRGERGFGPSSIVDPQCPEHSPGYRFGGRPVQPLALLPGTAAPPSRYGLDALDRLVGDGLAGEWVCDACGRSVGVLPCPEHQPRAYAEALAEVPF